MLIKIDLFSFLLINEHENIYFTIIFTTEQKVKKTNNDSHSSKDNLIIMRFFLMRF
jgi:hypothetical protein